jgi:SNF2 family DNA or RNA helicase
MALNGSWIPQSSGGYLFIWGETWRSTASTGKTTASNAVNAHPYGMSQAELTSNLPVSMRLKQSEWQWRSQIIALPTPSSKKHSSPPLLSSQIPKDSTDISLTLQPWQVEGFCLDPLSAVKFLQALPLGTFQAANAHIGSELRFWSQVSRWSLDLLSRRKFLPGIDQQPDGTVIATWQPLLDSAIDRARLEKFTRTMPAACRTYGERGEDEERGSRLRRERSVERAQGGELSVASPQSSPTWQWIEPQELLLRFLSSALDAQIRNWVEAHPLATAETYVQKWLQALSQDTNTIEEVEPGTVERLSTALHTWTSPVQDYLVTPAALDRGEYRGIGQNLFRTCFSLHPPASGEENWLLKYCLQATDAPEVLVDAETIWQHPVEQLSLQDRRIKQPQETLLKGLGLACRLYPPIEPSLHKPCPTSCQLMPIEVYEFIKSSAWRLQDSGLGVVLPPGLALGTGEKRLGISIKAEVASTKKNERLGLQSLLKFNWDLAIGDQTISKKEFDRLMSLRSPLVEVNGEWFALQPADVRAAQSLFTAAQDNMKLSVEDALRLSTGDTTTLEKLPVVKFEASGALQELITNLTGNRSIEPIEAPESFHGTLRPYQARGVSWLTFLERWGLGACLADDMGLGKCLSADSLIPVNGVVQTAAEIWETHANEQEFDGEGFWTKPTEQLLVNSIDEETGKIVQAPIRRLYRQQVCEKLRKVTLQDGSTIAITQRHKLLTTNGWTNNLKVGDRVCVPSKMLWEGKPEDPDLVKFLAWQIAEGNEQSVGALKIYQKDTNCLEDLRQTLVRIAQRYDLKINQPRLCNFPNQVAALRVNSQAYRRFLEAKGYNWGKRSRDKAFPPLIMQANLESVGIFLRNYFDAEGSVNSTMRSVEISTASPLLIQQLSVLLRRFGIWLRISPQQKRATNGSGILRTYYIGTFGGNSARRFLQKIGFGNPAKQQKLEAICQRLSNTNVEGIPASEIVAQAVETTKLPIRHFGMHNTVYINGSQQFSRLSLEKVLVGVERVLSGVAEQEYRLQKPSKWTLQTLERYAQLDKQQLNVTRQNLQCLFDREVFYCPIQEIEEIEYEGWVYDLEVNEHHNFVANNILCHNTIQLIAFLLHQKEQETLEGSTLLVCPTSVLGNWEREVKKFGPSLKTIVHHGDKRPKGKEFAKAVKDKHLVITSYPLVYRDIKSLEGVSWAGMVLDEAQNIKNPSAKQSQAVRQLQAGFRIALTGTPIENRLSELWSILDFLNPGYLGNRQFFQRRFAMPIEKYGDTDSLQTLRSLVQPFILRRLKTDKDIIQDLPEKQEMTVFCGLAAEQAALYQQLVDDSLTKIEEAEGIQRHGLILTLLLRLKQVCNHPALLNAKKPKAKGEKDILDSRQSGKLQRLEEMLEEAIAQDDHALIFTQFAEWGKLLQPHLEKRLGEDVLFLYGATRKSQREEMIDRFQNDPQSPRILILSLKAGGTGLNLTRANHVFHVDRWWNPAVENQATDRAFRIGQTRNVQVHKFVCTGTLEERINDIIESKKQLAEQTVDAGEQWLTQMDTNQLRNLLLLDRSAVIDEED